MKKKILLIPLALLLAVSLVAVSCAAPAPAPAEPIVIKALSFLPPQLKSQIGTMGRFAETVNERAKGELIIDWAGGPEVVGMFEQADSLKDGVIDMTHLTGGLCSGYVPEGWGYRLSEYTAQEERESGFFDWMSKLYEANMNARLLGRGTTHIPFYMWTVTRVAGPEELVGLKIGTMGIHHCVSAAVGATPVVSTPAEMYSALERGLTDGEIRQPYDVAAASTYEIVRYVIDHPVFAVSDEIWLVNLDTWNRLPKHLQDLMMEVALEMEAVIPDYFDDLLAGAWEDVILPAGVERVKWSPEDAKWFIDVIYEAAWDEVREQVSSENYAKLREFLTK